MLDFEKLDVYRTALEFVISTIEIRERLPRGSGELVDQFKRASFSIVLNIAEGAGKLKQADKQRYFSIARGSVMECGALFDLLNALYLHLSRGVSRWEALAYQDCRHAFKAMPSGCVTHVSGTFTFTCTSTSTSG